MNTRKEHIIKNNIKQNKSSLFIVPMIGLGSHIIVDEYISCYIDDDEKKIVLCFENSDREELKNIMWLIQTNDNFYSINYDDNDNEIVSKFNIPKKFEVDYNLFKLGRYTKFSNDYKEVLLNYYNRVSGAGKSIKIIDALYPDYQAKKYRADKMGVSINDLIDGEVVSIPEMEEERFIRSCDLVSKKEGEICEGK